MPYLYLTFWHKLKLTFGAQIWSYIAPVSGSWLAAVLSSQGFDDLLMCSALCLSALIRKVHDSDSALRHSPVGDDCRGVWEDCNERCPVLLVHHSVLIHAAVKLAQTH